LLLPEAFFQL